MGTPEENFETARDESSDDDARERAINQIETANECDMLSDLVRDDDLEEKYRELALESLAHPQCKPVLETLVEGGDLPETFQEKGESLLSETPDDAGAGP